MAGKIYAISSHQNFLKILVDFIISQKLALDRLTIVFPNRRAGLYFRYYLWLRQKKSIPIPKIYAIEDLVDELFVRIDPRPKISLYDEIYLIHNFVKDKPKFKDFSLIESFLPWGQKITEALDELDMELVDIERLNKVHLQSLSSVVTDVADELYNIYKYLEKIRVEEEYFFSTKGERYRRVAQNIKDLEIGTGHLAVAGFFVLTNSEKRIFRSWYEKGALIFVQGDLKEARQILKNYGFAETEEMEVETYGEQGAIGPDIRIYSSSDFHQMVWDVKEKGLLTNPDKAPDRNLILISDPGKLVPVLEFLGSEYNFNITMGFPFSKTEIGTFLTLWFNNFRRAKPFILKKDAFLAWISHGFFSQLTDKQNPDIKLTQIISESIRLFRRSCPDYINLETLIKTIEYNGLTEFKSEQMDFIKWVFEKFITPILTDIHGTFPPALLLEIINELFQIILGRNLDERYVRYIEKKENKAFSQKDLNDSAYQHFFVEVYLPIVKGKFGRSLFYSKLSLLSLFQRILLDLRIPLYGRPLVGNQVMGLLESRLLGFDRVIVLEANEGILPSIAQSNPILPEQLKELLGISRKETQEEIQRHHFRKLLESSREVHIYYISRTEGRGNQKRTKSRFVEEILWDYQKQGIKDKNIQELPIELDPKLIGTKGVIPKDEAFKALIQRRLCELPISATLLNTYLHCPYRFFYKYILCLDPQEEKGGSDEVELGQIIHKSIELFFNSQMDNGILSLTEAHRDRLLKTFHEEFRQSDLCSKLGPVRSTLLKSVAEHRICDFLDWLYKKSKRGTIHILGTEMVISLEKCKFRVIPFEINLEGRCDLILKSNDAIWIYDFKTGMPKKRNDIFSLKGLLELDLSSFDETEDLKSKFEEIRKSLNDIQLLFYLFLFYKFQEILPRNGSYVYLSTNIEEMEISLFSEKEDETAKRILILEKLPEIIGLLLFHMLNYEFIEPTTEDDMCKACRICI